MNWEGTWNLEIATPFGRHPATLVFARDGEGPLTGHIDSRLGNAPLRDISENGTSLDSVVSLDIQGRTYEADFKAHSNGDQVDGTIKVRLPIAPPMKFTGTRG